MSGPTIARRGASSRCALRCHAGLRAAVGQALWRGLAVAVLIAFSGCAPSGKASDAPPALTDWRDFEGTWTASGSRQTIPLGGERQASIVHLEGSLVLVGESRPAVGFRARVVAFNDSASGMVGRAVWTDERGDQVFSELQGEGTATRNRIAGTFLGGTGRYAGVQGGYEFAWRFVLAGEDGVVQGQSAGLRGRVRVGAASGVRP